MKRRIILSIALVLSIVLISLLTSSDSTVTAQNQMRAVADTGVVTLGPNQILRVTAAAGDLNGDDMRVRFRRVKYAQVACTGDGVCKQSIVSQTTSAAIMLTTNESAVVDAADYVLWRVVVLSNNRNAQVTAAIINASTGETVSHIIIANTEGDVH